MNKFGKTEWEPLIGVGIIIFAFAYAFIEFRTWLIKNIGVPLAILIVVIVVIVFICLMVKIFRDDDFFDWGNGVSMAA